MDKLGAQLCTRTCLESRVWSTFVKRSLCRWYCELLSQLPSLLIVSARSLNWLLHHERNAFLSSLTAHISRKQAESAYVLGQCFTTPARRWTSGLSALKSRSSVAQLLRFSLSLVLVWCFEHVLYNSLIEIKLIRHVGHHLTCDFSDSCLGQTTLLLSEKSYPLAEMLPFFPGNHSICLLPLSICSVCAANCADHVQSLKTNPTLLCLKCYPHRSVCWYFTFWSHTYFIHQLLDIWMAILEPTLDQAALKLRETCLPLPHKCWD